MDSFADHVFGGGPAGVLFTDEWLSETEMQSTAMENDLADTAFVVRRADGDCDLRWFMPKGEIDLNDYATLAAGYCLMEHLEPSREEVVFHTKSGPISVRKADDWLEMELPAVTVRPARITDEIAAALGRRPAELWFGENYLAVYETAGEVRDLRPDFRAMEKLEHGSGVFVTAPGDSSCDIVDRAFWPKMGVEEDPVCGNMHCNLAPYWTARMGKTSFLSHQLSPRGAEILCGVREDRVWLRGKASLFLSGTIYLPETTE